MLLDDDRRDRSQIRPGTSVPNDARAMSIACHACARRSGRGDVPLIELRFRCSQCGTDRTDFVVTSRDNPRPWRAPWRGENGRSLAQQPFLPYMQCMAGSGAKIARAAPCPDTLWLPDTRTRGVP